MKFVKLITLTFVITLLLGCGKGVAFITLPNGNVIKAELAQTPAERERGLMNRKSLADDEGMLFVFEDQNFRMFWMKDTFIDLDFLFISSDKTINNIYENVPRSYSYTPDEEVARTFGIAQYILEIPAGQIKEQNLKIGDKLEFTIE